MHRARVMTTAALAALGLSACAAGHEPPGGGGAGGKADTPGSATSALGGGTFEQVRDFGANPGELNMYSYTPAPRPEGRAPLVVAMHGCTQDASGFRAAGWERLADQYGFYLIYPEQRSSNNQAGCFNWGGEYGDLTNLRRGEGENLSIIEMVDHVKDEAAIDAGRVYVTGFSGGGAQAALMAALWPDVFAAAGTFAGIPYHCATDVTSTSQCVFGGRDLSPERWGDFVREAFPDYEGPYPRIAIWQGSSDSIVSTTNFTELLEQWTDVHGIDRDPDDTGEIAGYPREGYHDADGNLLVETVSITGQGHGQPVDPDRNCGSSGQYFPDADVCGAARMAAFFGLDVTDSEPPAVAIAAPSDGATLDHDDGAPEVRIDASDNEAVARVVISVDGDVRAELTSQPFVWRWELDGEQNGGHTLTAEALDASGNLAEDAIQVEVTGVPPDDTAPEVALTAPEAGAAVDGEVELAADASDDVAVASVAFSVDGETVGTDTEAPYTATWNAGDAAPGPHEIAATAVDRAGNAAEDAVSVSVADPAVAIASHGDGDTVTGVETVVVSAREGANVSRVRLLLDGALVGSDYSAPFEILLSAYGYASGEHTLTAEGITEDGSIAGTDSITVVLDSGF